jgi:hypothetical protein
MTCRSFGKSRDIKIKIKKPPLRDNGSIIYNKGKVTHAITIPNSFMQRIEAYDKAQYEPSRSGGFLIFILISLLLPKLRQVIVPDI